MKLGHSTASVSVDETKDHTEDLLTPSSVVPLGRPLYCERSQTPLQFLSESAYPTLCQVSRGLLFYALTMSLNHNFLQE